MGPSHGEQVTGFGVATQDSALSNTLTNLHHASTLRKCCVLWARTFFLRISQCM